MFRFSVAKINSFILVCLLWFIGLIVIYYLSEAVYGHKTTPKSENFAAPSVNIDKAAMVAVAPSSELLDVRLARADLEHGRQLFGQCGLCHMSSPNAPNRLGPHLWDIVARPVAFIQGFNYSNAIRQLGQNGDIWTYDRLDAFLTAPQRALKGTNMTYKGMNNAQDRADLLLYLRSLSENPQALPWAEKDINTQ